MSISIIYACNQEGVIGVNGEIPWRIPEDFQHFKQTTMSKTVVMGSKTWDSLPASVRPLPGRVNCVMTRNPEARVFTGAEIVSLQDVLKASELDNLFVIGGAELIRLFHPYADKIIETEVIANLKLSDTDVVVSCDTVPAYFSLIECSSWNTSSTGYQYRFKTYLKK
mgnify:FL=1